MNMLLGLNNLQADLISNWIGPAFFLVVAGFAIKFIISRQFRELAGFLGIAAVVGLLIFGGEGLFSETGVFYKIANGFSNALGGGGGAGTGTGNNGGMIRIIQTFIK